MTYDPSWFQVSEVAPGIHAIAEPGHVQSYLVVGSCRAALVDTGTGFADIRPALTALAPDEPMVLHTHWHYDHVGGDGLFREIGIAAADAARLASPVPREVLDELILKPCRRAGLRFPDGFEPDAWSLPGSRATFTVADGDRFDLGGRVLEAIATPGHTPGSVSYLDHATGALLCGDVAYDGLIFAQFVESELAVYLETLSRLAGRASALSALLPSHDRTPLEPTFLRRLRDALEALVAGDAPWVAEEGWHAPVRRWGFNGLEILTPEPGTPGVDLLRWPPGATTAP